MRDRFFTIVYHTVACWGLFCVAMVIYMLAAPILWVICKAGGVAQPRYALQYISYRFHRWYVGMLTQFVPNARIVFLPPNPVNPDGPVVYMANHQSVLDLLVLTSIISRMSIVGKRVFLYIPFFGLAMALTGMIFVDRKRKFESHDVFKVFRERLRMGEAILTFPQGSRSLAFSRKTVKRGLFKVLMEEKVPVIPIAITGIEHLLPKGRVFFDVHPRLKSTIHILPAVMPEGDPGNPEDITAFRNRVVEAIDTIVQSEKDTLRHRRR